MDRESLSLKLSEVLDDIGVNEKMVKKGRRVRMLTETIVSITAKSTGKNATIYHLGSQSEGTTTEGLKSDLDLLFSIPIVNVMEDLLEWEHGKTNYLMIQDENTTPGYCFLQLLRSDKPLPESVIPNEYHVTEGQGRILCKNTMIQALLQGSTQHGPSLVQEAKHGLRDRDMVLAFVCKSWPQSASGWLEREGKGGWPTQEMRTYASSTGCFVVPTGSKVSLYPELEWRTSTSLAERCLMFDLNITQIRCYVLMKMILKSFLNRQGEINISSFMCKTVLLHCIENTEPSIWKENSLLTCLINCLLKLHSCVQNDHLSHFIIQENHLMAGQFTAEVKHELSEKIIDFVQSDGQRIFIIDIDDLGHRLQVKLNKVPQRAYNFNSCRRLSASYYLNLALQSSSSHRSFLNELHNKDIRTLEQSVKTLMEFSKNGNKLEQDSFKFLAPFILTTYETVLASSSIAENNQVSSETMDLLSDGSDSDVSSSRLKMASVLYCSGDMEKAERILGQTEHQFYFHPVTLVCGCPPRPPQELPTEFMRICTDQSEDCIKHITAFCVRFTQLEINCAPHEIQYEMFRSSQDDMIHRDQHDLWMDWAVVDSLPFLFFLQFKI